MVLRVLSVTAVLGIMALSGCITSTVPTSDWAFEETGLDAAAAAGRDGSKVRIAVLDTGLYAEHPALAHLRDGDRQNGELMAFRDFLTGERGIDQAWDSHGHGTHVTALMAARPVGGGLFDARSDLRGGAPAAWYYSARVCGEDRCDNEAITDAVRWATSQQVDVITMSLGSERARVTIGNIDVGTSQEQQELENAINAAIGTGIVVIVSAGNDGPDNDDVSNPAHIRDVIAVGAVDKDLRVAPFSNRGDNPSCNPNPILPGSGGRCPPHEKPELVAPGVEIISAWLDDGYGSGSGTSQAAPIVASVVALMLEGTGGLSDRGDVVALKQELMDGARAVSNQAQPHDDAYGYGLVQVQ